MIGTYRRRRIAAGSVACRVLAVSGVATFRVFDEERSCF